MGEVNQRADYDRIRNNLPTLLEQIGHKAVGYSAEYPREGHIVYNIREPVANYLSSLVLSAGPRPK